MNTSLIDFLLSTGSDLVKLLRMGKIRELDAPSKERLFALVAGSRPGQEYTFDHLLYLVKPTSPEALVVALSELVRRGRLKQVIRVESPAHGGIRDFDSFKEIPTVLFDERTDQEVEVTPDRLRIVYDVLAPHATPAR